VDFSPDGKVILTGSIDGTARLWDAESGRPIGLPMRHDKPVRVACFSPDGKTILTGSADKTARLWKASTGRALSPPLEHERVIGSGAFTMGTSTEPWALDNERPAHDVHVPAFWIDTFPVTNEQYLQFVTDSGYNDSRWWSPEGWKHRQDAALVAPLFWQRDGASWSRIRFGVHESIPDSEPVQHITWFEADAYARWAGKRLPTEPEWEKAARYDPISNRSRRYPWGDDDPTAERANLGQQYLQPAPVGAYPAGASAYGVHQMVGDVWEWTASPFTGYPGFAAWPYREYSEAFFGSAYRVLRGGAWSVDPVAMRGTFRNWDLPIRRQIFAGFRCARDAED
jgi:iron(II)-dependent oxidoreductase